MFDLRVSVMSRDGRMRRRKRYRPGPVVLAATGLALCATMMSAPNALAQGEEMPMPMTDFVASWSDANFPEAVVRYHVDSNTLRIDAEQGGVAMVVLAFYETGRGLVYVKDNPAVRQEVPDMASVSIGTQSGRTDTYNGEECTYWDAQDGLYCLTDDAIPVFFEGPDGVISIFDISRTPQPNALFADPGTEPQEEQPLRDRSESQGGKPSVQQNQ
ncbi:MAG: hypothetical protein AAFX39_05870 [Pseudomonadota bacterium]